MFRPVSNSFILYCSLRAILQNHRKCTHRSLVYLKLFYLSIFVTHFSPGVLLSWSNLKNTTPTRKQYCFRGLVLFLFNNMNTNRRFTTMQIEEKHAGLKIKYLPILPDIWYIACPPTMKLKQESHFLLNVYLKTTTRKWKYIVTIF